jgi:hypothetical protein
MVAFPLAVTQTESDGSMNQGWRNFERTGKQFTCAFCGRAVASSTGYVAMESFHGGVVSTIEICPNCSNPTYFQGHGRQIPDVPFGATVAHISDFAVESIYEEARHCAGRNAFTAAVLLCRKLLMHIAVQHGAPENQSFAAYVTYLDTAGYIPPNGKKWVDSIRQKGNEANHEICLMSEKDARNIIRFAEMLLRFIYEMPNMHEADT